MLISLNDFKFGVKMPSVKRVKMCQKLTYVLIFTSMVILITTQDYQISRKIKLDFADLSRLLIALVQPITRNTYYAYSRNVDCFLIE